MESSSSPTSPYSPKSIEENQRMSFNGQEYPQKDSIFTLRVATYNILNTSDRYEEREQLLKKNIYELNADVIGMQEVAFGSKQLDELVHPKGDHLRHNVNHLERGRLGYQVYEAPF